MRFVNRITELAFLNKYHAQSGFQFVPLYGRSPGALLARYGGAGTQPLHPCQGAGGKDQGFPPGGVQPWLPGNPLRPAGRGGNDFRLRLQLRPERLSRQLVLPRALRPLGEALLPGNRGNEEQR